jgi:hypothetical protein
MNMAIEFIDINKGKEHIKSNTSAAKEITEASVKESVISSTLNTIRRGITIRKDNKAVDIKYVLQQSNKETKVWVLTLKYGVAPVSMAKITAISLEEAKSDAIKYVEGLKTKMSDNVVSQIRAAVDNKKKSLAKARKTREERDEAKVKNKA